ncbi:hypothetical protein Trco_007245 [Trichoderma cornu-damae]|uniref:Uncharacterized protein n=1 Tax=Trichoderma cornu-damae TaxID=654480 RepID=A0A9P8TSX7_9HYPO|nr:hypothetical protein Trco_007245 [Trichoderma cornu-damae]
MDAKGEKKKKKVVSAILGDQELIRLERTLSHAGHDDSADALLDGGRDALVQLHGGVDGASVPPAVGGGQDGRKGAQHRRRILFQVVDDAVRAGVKGVGGDGPARLGVDGLDGADACPGHVVHVEDGGVGVGAGGVEGVGVAHGDLGELGKVAVLDGVLHQGHVGGHDRGYPLLEEARGGDGLLHARGGRDALLGGADDQDQGPHAGPVRRGGDELGPGVAAVGPVAHPPGDVAAEEAAAGGAGALAGDQGQLRGGVGELVEVGDGLDEGGKAGGGRGQAGGRGEVVLGDDAEGPGRQPGQGGVGGLEGGSAGAQLAEAGLGPGARNIRGLAVEEEAVVAGVGGGARGGRQGAEMALGERHREGAVGGEVELCVTFAPQPI